LDKDAEAFRTISEVGEELDLPQHVLRFWETRFTQIRPIKRGGGRRYYRPEDCDLLRGIKHLLYGEGYTIKGVQRILKEEGVRTVQAVGRAGTVVDAGLRQPQEPSLDQRQGNAHDGARVETQIEAGSGTARREPVLGRQGSGKATPDPFAPEMDSAAGGDRRPPASFEPHIDARHVPPTVAKRSPSVGIPPNDPVLSPIVAERRMPRQDPSAPALPGFEPAADFVAPVRKVKPKQLALFEGMEEEGLSSKDREALRQVLEKIAECRKLIASADLMETAEPAFVDP
jgi:DNA-binding transcriptional MerR regulator